MSSSGKRWDDYSLMLSIHHFLCRPRRRPPSIGEAAVACDMPGPCKFPSQDSCQKRFMWTHKEADHAPHPVVGLVLQAGDVEKFPQTLGFESLDPFFFRVSKQGPCFTTIERQKVTRGFYSLNLLAKLMVLHRQILSIAATAEAILMRISAGGVGEWGEGVCVGVEGGMAGWLLIASKRSTCLRH